MLFVRGKQMIKQTQRKNQERFQQVTPKGISSNTCRAKDKERDQTFQQQWQIAELSHQGELSKLVGRRVSTTDVYSHRSCTIYNLWN